MHSLSHTHFLEAKLSLGKKRRELEAALKAGRTFATILRDLRKHELGSRGSREWEALGFRGTRQVPLTTDALYVMLGAMAGQLERHPEVGVPGLGITATGAEGLMEGLSGAVAAVNLAKADVQRAVQARAVLLSKGRRLVRKVLNDLMYVMDPLDGRWVEFGFNLPGLKTTPAAPEKVTAIVFEESNAVWVQWPAVPLAESYRVSVRVVGVDAEFKSVGRTSETSFLWEEMPRGAEVEVVVSAINPRGEGRMSEVVVVEVLRD